MPKVEAWEAEDGTLHRTETAMLKHEMQIKGHSLIEWLSIAFMNYGFRENFTNEKAIKDKEQMAAAISGIMRDTEARGALTALVGLYNDERLK